MTTAPHPINVLLVDDDPEDLQTLKHLLSTDGRIGVVREASSAAEAIDCLRELHPDVVMLDIGLAQSQAGDTTRVWKAMLHDSRILVIANSGDLESPDPLITLEISGFLLKTADPQEIRLAVHEAAAGRPVFSSEVARRLVSLLREGRPAGEISRD